MDQTDRLVRITDYLNDLQDMVSNRVPVPTSAILSPLMEMRDWMRNAASLSHTTESSTRVPPSGVVHLLCPKSPFSPAGHRWMPDYQNGILRCKDCGEYEPMAFTTPPTPASSQSAPTTTESGPVEQNSGCAHKWKRVAHSIFLSHQDWGLDSCQKCSAYQWFGRILVPAAATTPLTSVSRDNPIYVEP